MPMLPTKPTAAAPFPPSPILTMDLSRRTGRVNLALEQALDLACLGVDVDVKIPRRRGKTRDGLDVSRKRVPSRG